VKDSILYFKMEKSLSGDIIVGLVDVGQAGIGFS
jgi:hypothetical protein